MHGRIDVDLFVCGGVEILGNSMYKIFHSKKDDAFKPPCVGALSCGNPENTAESVPRTLQKPTSDFGKDSYTASFMLVLPYWKCAP